MKRINENSKVTLTLGQLRRLVRESTFRASSDQPNYIVYIWLGSGYATSPFAVVADSPEQALERAVAIADNNGWRGLLMDPAEVEEDAAEVDIFDPFTGEGSPKFEETYTYVDATMEGASQPWYIYAENLRIEELNKNNVGTVIPTVTCPKCGWDSKYRTFDGDECTFNKNGDGTYEVTVHCPKCRTDIPVEITEG